MTLPILTTLFGWMIVVNVAILFVASASILTLQEPISTLHSRMFAMPAQDVKVAYFRWLAQYKLLTLVLCVTPYIALRLI